MAKTIWMMLGLASVFLFGTACFRFLAQSEPPGAAIEACAGLSGEAKTDCERRHAR